MIALVCMTEGRKRKPVAYRIDTAMLKALEMLAKDANMSANRYLETLIYETAMKKGFIEEGTEMLGETRGGGGNKIND